MEEGKVVEKVGIQRGDAEQEPSADREPDSILVPQKGYTAIPIRWRQTVFHNACTEMG